MLARRIIPTLLCRRRQLIKGKQFKSWRAVGAALQGARVHAMRAVDELCILDISATEEGRGPDLHLVEELSESCFIPVTVGGGIRSVDDAAAVFRAGADKVCVGTAGLSDETLLGKLSDRFGCQAIVASVDYIYTTHEYWDAPRACVMSHCGKTQEIWVPQSLPYPPVMWAKLLESKGVGEILLTDIEREGMMHGYDLPMIKQISEAVSIPVIAHGGCGNYNHMLDAINAGADAVAAGSVFQFTDNTPRGAAKFLFEHNVEVRL